jgi:tetratricopeptide (TPR) repeat protein
MPPETSPKDLITQISAALDSGKTPRVRKPLKDAIRVLSASGDHGNAAKALQLLARLEMRVGEPRRALNAVRSAQRQAQRNGSSGLITGLHLLACIHAALGEDHGGQQALRRATSLQGSPADQATSLLVAVHVATAADRLADAADHAQQALDAAEKAPELLPKAQLRLGQILLEAGCSQAVEPWARLAAGAPDPVIAIRGLLLRGNNHLTCGRLDPAARYFRAASRLAKNAHDARWEPLSLASLGVVEIQRSRENEAARRRADSAVRKSRRLAARLRDRQLNSALEQIEVKPGRFPTPKHAAEHLVRIGGVTESRILVDACIAEVRYLGSLEQDQPPYPYAPLPLSVVLL